MQVYLLRHAAAEDAASSGRDPDRALTPDGKKKLREVMALAKSAGVAPDVIITSPFKRAIETAEIAASVLGYKEDLLRTNALVPDAAPEEVWTEISVHRDCEQVLLTSHEPLMSRTTAYLLNSGSLAIDFKKSGLARIDVDRFSAQPHGVLKWYLTPKLAG